MKQFHIFTILLSFILVVACSSNSQEKNPSSREGTLSSENSIDQVESIPISKSDIFFQDADKLPVFEFGQEHNNINHYFFSKVKVPDSFLQEHDTLMLFVNMKIDKYKTVLLDSTLIIKTKGRKVVGAFNVDEVFEEYHLGDEFTHNFKEVISQLPVKEAAIKNGKYVNCDFAIGLRYPLW